MSLTKQIAVGLLVSLVTFSSLAEASNCETILPPDKQSEKILAVNLTGIGIVTAWGIVKWDYFSRSPHAQSEGWFQNDTDSGGADKLGHLYTTYVTAHGLSNIYEFWCIDKDDAALYGALSSFAILGYMEIGDSFSNYGFSKEDFIANAAGALFGYITHKDQELSNILDLRWEYGFHPNGSDFATDYENSKYLLALKMNGFESFSSSFLRHFEFHLGYYTRGFSDPDDTKERNLYAGIGLNLTDLFERHGHHKTSILLKYMQIPGTNVEFEKDLNK